MDSRKYSVCVMQIITHLCSAVVFLTTTGFSSHAVGIMYQSSAVNKILEGGAHETQIAN